MRTLTPTLTAAQKVLSSLPAVLVTIRNRVGSALRLSWASLYAGTEPDSYHAAVCPGDSSLVRARTDGTTVLYSQRIATPGAGSDYSAWTQVPGMLITGKGIALAALGAKVALFYVADNVGVNTLYCRESTDNGATWGSAVQVKAAAAPSDFGHIAAAYVSTDVLICFYTTGASSQTLHRIIRTLVTWGASAAWSNSSAGLTGISASYQSDVELLIAGKDGSSNYLLWSCVYGLGVNQANDTWSALKIIRKTHSGTLVSYKYPYILFSDVFRESFVEVYTGSESYTRTMGLHSVSVSSFIANLHHDDYRLPLLSGSYGFALANNATHMFLSTSKALYWASNVVSAILASAGVLSVRQVLRPFGSSLEVFLNNASGIYNTPAFNKGWEVDFQPGYYSTSGAEYSSGQAYYIEEMEHITGQGKAQLRLIALDALGLLSKSQARSAIEFNKSSNEKTYKDLVEYFLHLSGFTLTVVSSSSPFTGEYPKTSIYAGSFYDDSIKKLFSRLNDLIYIRGTEARSFNPSSSDASVYSYGGANHPLIAGRYASASLAANRFQVQGGASVYADAFVQSEIDRVYGRFKAFIDVNADTVAKASALAAALLAKEQYYSSGGEISIPVNCGQELYDVIDITDSGAGLSAAKRRVFAIELTYDAFKGKYGMVLTLGGV